MTAIEFEEWVKIKRWEYETKNEKPVALKEKLLERLKGEIFTLESSVMGAINAFNGYESLHQENEPFKETLELITTIQPLLFDRTLLKTNLLMLKASILNLKKQEANASETYSHAISLIQPLHLEVDKRRIQCLLSLAELMLWMHDKEKADALFLNILSYPWYLVDEPESFHLLRDYYLQAGRGLIECRRGNLAALKEIFFVPATYGDLMPVLEKALEEVN